VPAARPRPTAPSLIAAPVPPIRPDPGGATPGPPRGFAARVPSRAASKPGDRSKKHAKARKGDYCGGTQLELELILVEDIWVYQDSHAGTQGIGAGGALAKLPAGAACSQLEALLNGEDPSAFD
jgi:hypothetical protein